MSRLLSFSQYGDEVGPIRLTITSVSAIFLSLLLLYRAGLYAYRVWFDPLSRYPGPKLWAASSLPYNYTCNITGSGIRQIGEFHKRYGPIVRIAPDRLSFDGSIGWPQIYALRAAGHLEYEKNSKAFPESAQYVIIAAPREIHRRQRRQLGHAFSDAAMYEQEGIIDHYVKLLIQRVQEHVDAGKELDIVKWLNFTTFDIIGDLTFGESFDSLQGSDYHPWVLSLFDGIKGDSFVRACRSYPMFAPFLIRFFGPNDQLKKSQLNRELARTKGMARIQQGIAPKGRRDFMTYMLQTNRDGEPGLSTREVLANSPLLVFAGSETTATALSGFFFYLNQTPRAKELLIREIRDAFKDESEINMVSTNKLEYLHATLEETLRFYPPVASTPPRVSPGAEIEGHFVPKGTLVQVSQWATFRNPDHFHAPNSFCPERWLKRTHPHYDPKFANDNHAVFKPFSVGPRDCIGKNLSYSEMRLIVANLLFKFDVELLPEQDDWHAAQNAYTIWDKGPLHVKFTSRVS